MKENVFQKHVTDFLNTQNTWFIKYWAGAFYTKQGIPDILACINGVFHGIELKTDVGKPTKLQLYNIRKIKDAGDRKSTRLNSSHVAISYAVFCLKKKIIQYDNNQ